MTGDIALYGREGLRRFRIALWRAVDKETRDSLYQWSRATRAAIEAERQQIEASRPEAARRFYCGIVAGSKVAVVLRTIVTGQVSSALREWREVGRNTMFELLSLTASAC